MVNIFASSYELSNGICTVNGVVQSSTEACTGVASTAAWIFALIFIPLILLGIAFFVFWVLMLIHAIKNEDLKDRTIWLAVLLGSFVLGSNWLAGPIYYFLAKRPYDAKKTAELNKPAAKPKTAKKAKKASK